MATELIPIESSNPTAAAWGEATTRWLESVERRRGSARSRKEYQKILRDFFTHLEGKHPAMVSGADCQRWVAKLTEQGLAPATLKTRLGAISSFYKFVTSRYEVAPGQYLHHFNPTTVVQRPHVNPYEKSQGLSAEQARAILVACDRSTVKGLRDFALISFYLYTGRRRAEIARLRWADLRPGSEPGQWEYHSTGKGNKTAWWELPAPVWSALEAYLKHSGRLEQGVDQGLNMEPQTPLFVAHKETATAKARGKDQPIAERIVHQVITSAARRAGLERVKPHALRHTAAKLRRAGGETLESVSAFLDHANLSTTQVYLGAIEAMADAGWRKVEALIGLGEWPGW